jgi:type IV pilus assembly protein PilQ
MTRVRMTLTAGLLACLAGPALFACTRLPEETKDVASQPRRLEGVRVTDSVGGVRVEMEAAPPWNYALSTNLEPATVTVELPGMERGPGVTLGEINKPPVLRFQANEVLQPRPGLHVVFHLTSPVEPDVRTEGNKLVMDFPFPRAARTADGPPPLPEATATAGTGPAGPPARTMSKVDVRRGEGEVSVVLLGDGAFAYQVRQLGRDRLVIDLANVETPLRYQLLPVDHPLLKQIRIGQHSNRVRLVLDLPKPSDYSVEPGPGSLAIRLFPPRQPAGAAGGGATAKARAGRVEPADSPVSPDRPAGAAGGGARAQMATDPRSPLEAEEGGRPRYSKPRISLDVQGAELTHVLRSIAEVSGFNIVVGEGVKAKVNMNMRNVPWDQALDMLLKMNNLGKIEEGNVVWIDSLANIARQQEEEAKAKESKIKAEDLVTRVLYVQNVPVQEIHRSLQQYLSPRGQVTFNTASNALIIKDTESYVVSLVELARSLDLEVPQVQIEARIVQADTSYTRSLGIQWGVSNTQTLNSGAVANVRGQGQTTTDPFGGQTNQFLVNLPAVVSGLSAVPGLGFTYGKLTGDGALLDLRLTAGEQLGLTKVVAAPKILTLDKREAKIEQGQSVPYQTTSLQGTQTTFVDALLSLKVTPQITSRDPKEAGKQILLKLKVTRNSVGTQSSQAGPSIDKKEAETQLLVRDGETAVIGGIFQDEVSNTVTGIPWLSRIPVIGWLFKNKVERTVKNELLIFLTPSIVKT